MKALYEEIVNIIPLEQLETIEKTLGWDEYEIVVDFMEFCFDNSYKFSLIAWEEYFHEIY